MNARRHDEIPPWEGFEPIDRATLVFVFRGDEVLLIRKKRGLGAGKINGPGGRLEGCETPIECARREVVEELCITPTGLEERGELRFNFVDGHSLHAIVFTASGHHGEPRETDEAIPLWCARDAIPYDEMWADDRLWFPHLLAGRRFRGSFLFDGDSMMKGELLLDDASSASNPVGIKVREAHVERLTF
ncbi:MAG: 8-oxo-dGTP diphosphatase [Polyangiaceae bacterium]